MDDGKSELTVYHCPKCGRQCDRSGTIEVTPGWPLAVFQCDDCMMDVEFDGTKFPVAYTYAVGPDGRLEDVPMSF